MVNLVGYKTLDDFVEKYQADTQAEALAYKTEGVPIGSRIIAIDTGNVIVLNSTGQWKVLP